MDVTLYLPDDLGARAKAEFARGEMSRIAQDAFRSELERRDEVAKTLNETETYEIYLEDEEERGYTGRVTGARIALVSESNLDVEVFLTDDERVILYDASKRRHWVLDDPVEELRDWLPEGVYVDVLHSLGETPVVDL